MLKLLLVGGFGIIIIIAIIIVIRNKPDIWFWLFLNLFFDPGGYVGEYLGGTLIGPLTIADISFAGIIVCLITANFNWEVIFDDKLFVNFLLSLLIFYAYYFIVYGAITPYLNNDFDYQTFLLKNRIIVYGLIILISVYLFSLKGLKYFYCITIFIGVICLSLYIITLLTGLNLSPVWRLDREGTEMTRIIMGGYGIFDLLFPLALSTYLLSKKINLNLRYVRWLYFGGVLMLITQIITLTRRTQIDIIGSTLIIVVIISYLFRTGKLREMFKIIIPVITVILVLSVTFPKYGGYVIQTAEDTFLLMATGKDSRGMSDQRVSGSKDYKIVNEYIRNNLFFGTGYTYLYWASGGGSHTFAHSNRGDNYALAADAAGEVPIYYILFGFGLVGAILILPIYFIIGELFLKLIKLLRLELIDYLLDPLTLIFSIYFLLSIAAKFTYNLWSLGGDFFKGSSSSTAVLMGVGFAIYRKINLNNLYKNN